MKQGHVTGKKRERKSASEWYQKYYEEHLARIEREHAQQQAAQEEQAA